MHQVGRSGDESGHGLGAQCGDQLAECFRPGVVDVGHGVGVEDQNTDRRGGGVQEVLDPLRDVIGVALPQWAVQQVHDYSGDLLGFPADVRWHPVRRAGLAAHHHITGSRGPSGAVGQAQQHGHHDALRFARRTESSAHQAIADPAAAAQASAAF